MGHKGWLNEAISNRAAVIRQPLSNLEKIFFLVQASKRREKTQECRKSIGNQFDLANAIRQYLALSKKVSQIDPSIAISISLDFWHWMPITLEEIYLNPGWSQIQTFFTTF